MLVSNSFLTFVAIASVLSEQICIIAYAEKISNHRLCGDRSCQTLLSKARTLARHRSTDPAFLPFEKGEIIDIYSKSAGSRQDLWGGELNGKSGYFPRSFVREYKVDYENPQFVVETEHHIHKEQRGHDMSEKQKIPQSSKTVLEDDVHSNQETKPRNVVTEYDLSEDSEEIKKHLDEDETQTADPTEIGDETELENDEQNSRKTEYVSLDAAVLPSVIKSNHATPQVLQEQGYDPTEDETETTGDETISKEVENMVDVKFQREEGSNRDENIGDEKSVAKANGINVDLEIEKHEDEIIAYKTKDEKDGEAEVKLSEGETNLNKNEDADETFIDGGDDLEMKDPSYQDNILGGNKNDLTEENENMVDESSGTSDKELFSTIVAETENLDEGSMFGSIVSAVMGSFQNKSEADNTKSLGNSKSEENEIKKAKEKGTDTRHENKKEDDKGLADIKVDYLIVEEQKMDGHHEENNIDEGIGIEYRSETKDNKDIEEKTIDLIGKNIEFASDERDFKENTGQSFQRDDLGIVDSEGDMLEELQISYEQKKQTRYPGTFFKEMQQDKKEDKTPMHGKDNDDALVQALQTDTEILSRARNKLAEESSSIFEELSSDRMFIQATLTLDKPSIQVASADFEESFDSIVAGTEFTEYVSESFMSVETDKELEMTDMAKHASEQVPPPITVSHTSITSTQSPNSLEEYKYEMVQDANDGDIVIDDETVTDDYFGQKSTSEATQEIIKTSLMDISSLTKPSIVKSTKLVKIPANATPVLFPSKNVESGSHNSVQTDTSNPANTHATFGKQVNTESQDIEPSHKEDFLQTSFGFSSQSVDYSNTISVDVAHTEDIKNKTLQRDTIKDHMQPSLNQNAYTTEVYVSRKPLSTDQTTLKSDIQFQQIDSESKKKKLILERQDSSNIAMDENNNNKIVDESATNLGDWTVFGNENHLGEPVDLRSTGSLDQTELYSQDESKLHREVLRTSLDKEMKQSEETLIKILEPFLKSSINMLPTSVQSLLEEEPVGLSPTVTMFVTVISTTILSFLTCLGFLCKGANRPTRKKDPLVVIRDLEEKLFIATKEKENLQDDLQIKNKTLVELQRALDSQQSTTDTVGTDLKAIQLHNEVLKRQLSGLQKELEGYKQEITEKNQIVSHKLSEVQTYQTDFQTLTKQVQDVELTLRKTNQELDEKEEELRNSLQQVQSQYEQIQQLETSKQQLQDEVGDWSEKLNDMTERIEQFSIDSKRMQEDLDFKENELEVLRDCFLQVKAFQGEEVTNEEAEECSELKEKLKQMMDVSRVNARLNSVEDERDVLQNKLLIEIESRKELEDQVQLLKRKFENNQTDKLKAERQCQEAQTKLEVLSKYFKEKEAELTRQLGEQEVLKNQNISKLKSSGSITQELTKENETYRHQIEDLRTEISKAERDFRSQIAANEKKAHENWLATRAAERELKESRHECGMLRQKLTDLERKLMQGPPPGLIRPITHRAMPPPAGMMPPPPPERPGSRGSVQGHVTPRLRENDYNSATVGPDRIPLPDRRLPSGSMGPRPLPLDTRSPPPFAMRPSFPPEGRSPPPIDRYHQPRGPRPPFPRPPPPHMRSPPLVGSIPSEHGDSRQDQAPPHNRISQESRERGTTRHQSQV